MTLASALVISLLAAANDPANDIADKVIAVTLYRELQSDDYRYDHRLMLAVIRNRAFSRSKSMSAICLERWQFSYWNRFWLDGKSTLTVAALEHEYSKVPKTFISEWKASPPFNTDTLVNHFYCPAAMRPKFSEPTWARGKTPKYITNKFRYYAL